MKKWIIAAATATAVLAWFAPDEDSVVVASAAATPSPGTVAVGRISGPCPRNPPGAAGAACMADRDPPYGNPAVAPQQAPAIPPALQIQRRLEDEDAGNLFAGGAAPAEAPVKPAAARTTPAGAVTAVATPANGPALAFLGSYRDGGQATYLLQADGQDIVARVGDVVQGAYRLDGEADGTLSFTYLPRNQSITLALTHAPGEAN